MTGLSEEQRAIFSLMKDMGAYTKQDPKKTAASLETLSKKWLDDWKLSFNTELVRLRARLLKPILEQGLMMDRKYFCCMHFEVGAYTQTRH